MRRETSGVSLLMCPFCVCSLLFSPTTVALIRCPDPLGHSGSPPQAVRGPEEASVVGRRGATCVNGSRRLQLVALRP